MSQVQTRNKSGEALSLINYTVSLSSNPDDAYIDDFFTDLFGNSTWPRIGMPTDKPLFLHFNYYSKDKKYQYQRYDAPAGFGQDITVNLEEVPLEQVAIDGDRFYTGADPNWKMKFGSNFMLPQLVAEGIDIVPLLYSKLNGYRLFGTHKIIAEQAGLKPWHPDFYPNWLEATERCADILLENNKYFCLNLICDNQLFGKDRDFLRNLQNQVIEMLRRKRNAFYSLGNENEKNGFDANDFDRPDGIISACGSGLTGGPAPLSRGKPWNVQYQHLRRDLKMFIDIPPVDAPTYWLEHKLLFDETIGFADFNDPGKRTNNADWAYKMGRIMSAFNGGVIHLHSGGHSQPLGNIENFCKDEFCRGFAE